MTATTDRRRRAARAEPAPERATALVLVPTLMLVMLTLAAIALDLSAVHSAHRSGHRVVSAAADDAANMIDTTELQLTGELLIDPDSAARVATAHVAAAQLPGALAEPVRVEVSPARDTVTVSIELDVPRLVVSAVPGVADHERLSVRARARLHR